VVKFYPGNIDKVFDPGKICRFFARTSPMSVSATATCTAFDHHRLIASGPLAEVVRAAKLTLDAGASEPLLIFDDRDSRQIEVDFRGTLTEVLARLPDADAASARGPGRPKLGVVPREVTLLPRHWDWLAAQPGGASAVLRRLVEQAARSSGAKERARRAVESVDRFMRVIGGDLPGYEEASRAFYRGDRAGFDNLVGAWPADVRAHLQPLVAIAWDEQADAAAA
jgi:uncharacterized protein